jgi:transcriptional regulator with XRE-family HTH domain
VTPDQLKAARTLLGWSYDRVGSRSGTSAQMVSTFEKTGRIVPMNIPAGQYKLTPLLLFDPP